MICLRYRTVGVAIALPEPDDVDEAVGFLDGGAADARYVAEFFGES
jgi:hypothetical protein